MDTSTIENIRQNYLKLGIQVSLGFPLMSEDPFDRFTLTENGVQTVLSKKEFLQDAKGRGLYHEPITFCHLELTDNISAQESLLCKELRWTNERLNATLSSLARKDTIALTITTHGRRIGIVGIPLGSFDQFELMLMDELTKYRTH